MNNREFIGTVRQSDLGMRTWTLVSDQNVTYEIMQPVDKNLLQEGLRVKVTAMVRADVMSMAMVGEVIEIVDYSILPTS